jgi:hypothetical protein
VRPAAQRAKSDVHAEAGWRVGAVIETVLNAGGRRDGPRRPDIISVIAYCVRHLTP